MERPQRRRPGTGGVVGTSSALQSGDDLRPVPVERSPVFGRVNAWTMLDCGTWPVPPRGDVGPIRAPGAAPVLLVSYTDDAATPLSNAQAVQAQLERGSLLIREGTGHGAYASNSACIDRSVDAYLVNGALPGFVCLGRHAVGAVARGSSCDTSVAEASRCCMRRWRNS
ncbi:alpha/beta hydrolase [Streptomyces sp. NPDC086554]|uniref:alpha/beta hydrolase n=1 Tax=Streptomyces sp. NPDC086554 TaxID=3154864 RepID=UPI0034438C9C